MFSVQQPIFPAVFNATQTTAAWKQKPSWYIVASEDGAINPDLERMMAKRGGAKTTEIKASHVSMNSKPQEVLKVILEAIKTVIKEVSSNINLQKQT